MEFERRFDFKSRGSAVVLFYLCHYQKDLLIGGCDYFIVTGGSRYHKGFRIMKTGTVFFGFYSNTFTFHQHTDMALIIGIDL